MLESVVLVAKVLHAIASCLAGPVLAAISLGLIGHTLMSTRLGRNSSFLSLGNAIAAGLMAVAEGVAVLAGASTIPEARRKGAQRALLQSRLQHASDLGCDLGQGHAFGAAMAPAEFLTLLARGT